MLNRFSLQIVLTLLLLALVNSSWAKPGFSLFANKKTNEFLPVEEAFKYQAWVEANQLTVIFTLAPDYYLYKDKLKVEIDPAAGLQLGEVSYPAALVQEDEFFGLTEVYYQEVVLTAPLIGEKKQAKLNIKLSYQGCADAGLCYPPETALLSLGLNKLNLPASPKNLATSTHTNSSLIPAKSANSASINQPPTNQPSVNKLSQVLNSGQTWLILGLFFVAGLGLTFTPCVLPMLPILSTIIIGKGTSQPSKTRGFALSTAYALGMALAYALIGAAMGWFGAGLNLQAAMQTPWLLIPAALIFVLLALALFDVFNLQLPAWLTNKLEGLNQPKGGTLINVALMGALSSLVVSPCLTAPLAGALAFIAATGKASLGAAALFMLGLGMGVPLIITGTFGGHWLPKAGNWMNQVKAFFGLLMLAMAAWLLDRLLPASLSLAMWGLLALGTGVYLGGLNFKAATGWAKLRLSLGLALIIYAASLLMGALAGNTNPLQPLHGVLGASSSNPPVASLDVPVFNNLTALDSFLASSQQPVLLDLYADWCISCKVMDARVFPRPEIQQQLAGFQHVKLDLTRTGDVEKAWLKTNQLFGPPTLMFYHQGKELVDWRLAGEVNAKELLEHLAQLNLALK